jgi:hypothetical protein
MANSNPDDVTIFIDISHGQDQYNLPVVYEEPIGDDVKLEAVKEELKGLILHIHEYHSHFIAEGIAEVSQIFF